MLRLIVTGPNGAGKSTVAARLSAECPEVPVFSLDRIKLTSGWKQRPKSEVEAELRNIVQMDRWIVEGGPSLLPLALARADAVMWLDTPDWIRAWRLLLRPWLHFGRTRQELPAGNVDWPTEQYGFAIRSLKNSSKFRQDISACLEQANHFHLWRVRNVRQLDRAVDQWRAAQP